MKLSAISLYLTKLYVAKSFAKALSVKYSEICQNFSNSVTEKIVHIIKFVHKYILNLEP